MRGGGLGRVTRLLLLACLVAAICLFASELMTTFAFTTPGGEVLDTQGGVDRHGAALALIAVFAIGALAIAVLAASKPAAAAVAVAGVVALLVFLLVDLPDANAVGALDDARQSFFDAEAVPQGGFFLEMTGALALAVSGIALATLSPEQLAALRPRWLIRGDRGHPKQGTAAQESSAGATGAGARAAGDSRDGEAKAARHRLTRRPRARQRG